MRRHGTDNTGNGFLSENFHGTAWQGAQINTADRFGFEKAFFIDIGNDETDTVDMGIYQDMLGGIDITHSGNDITAVIGGDGGKTVHPFTDGIGQFCFTAGNTAVPAQTLENFLYHRGIHPFCQLHHAC